MADVVELAVAVAGERDELVVERVEGVVVGVPGAVDPADLLPWRKLLSTIPYWDILSSMHVIAKPVLVEFWTKHPDAAHPLEAWYRSMRTEVFTNFTDLRETFSTADYVDGLTVFNICGNKYRLIASIHYNRHKVYIRAVLTHEDYNRDGWKRTRRN